MTLRQLMAYGRILETIIKNGNDVREVDRFSLRKELSVIATGSEDVADIITVESIDKIYLAIISCIDDVFKSYQNQIINVNYATSVTMPYTTEKGTEKVAILNVRQNVSTLPSEFWGAILTKVDKIKQGEPVVNEIQNIPFVLSRIAWEDENDMFVKDISGKVRCNNGLVADKEHFLLDANALEAVRAYVFFLTIRGIYSTDPNLLYSKKALTTRISNLRESASNFLNDGAGLDSLKILLQGAMTGSSTKN